MMNTKEEMTLTKEQKDCVDFSAGDLLVKGVAGSGKSVVILKRALKLYQKSEGKACIHIFTYVNSLVKYTNELLGESVGSKKIEVSTVDSYCRDIYLEISHRRYFKAQASNVLKEIIKDVLKEGQGIYKDKHRFYEDEKYVDFLLEEFRWIREKCILNQQEYIEADRRGRGSQVRLSQNDKEKVWGLYSMYSLQTLGKREDWPDIYLYLYQHLDEIPEKYKIDYIFVDEAQDMTVGKLKVLKYLCKKAITVAADVAQKIYTTSFTWKEVGIDITGRSSKCLSKSFRSTKEIVMLAEDLMQNNRKNSKIKDEFTDAVLPEVSGPIPELVCCSTKLAEEKYMLELLKQSKESDEVIGVVCRTNNDIFRMKKKLEANRLEYQVISNKEEWSLLQPGIKIVTAHSSKGLEFDMIIIPDLNENIYPLNTFVVDNEQLEEHLETERNILYVAMTRAREELIMLCQNATKSRFVEELDKKHYKWINI